MFSQCMCGFSPGTPASSRLIGDSKFSLGVRVSVDGCLEIRKSGYRNGWMSILEQSQKNSKTTCQIIGMIIKQAHVTQCKQEGGS